MIARADDRRTGPRSPRLAAFGCLALVLGSAGSALAAKWVTGCPEARVRLIHGGRGGGVYTSSYFAHVGHEVTYHLKESQVVREGGFSIEPGGNTVEVTFTPHEGDPIPLPPFDVTGVSSATLSFVLPNTQPLLGRLVVGPMQVVIRRGGTVVAEARRPVALPPMNDVHALASEGGEIEVLAAMDGTAAIWIPLSFGGFGPGPFMPECPAEMTPITALAADFSFRGPDPAIPYAKFRNLKSSQLFLGDFVLGGVNLYGKKLGTLLNVKRLPGGSIALCALNDTLELILRVPLRKVADNPGSDLIPLVRDGSPLVVKLRNVSADPDVAPALSALRKDSFGTPCEAAP